jgi:hypothetical protein
VTRIELGADVQADQTMTNLYADIVAFGPTPMPDGCGCEYPGDRTAIDQYMNNNITGMRPFVGNLGYCSDSYEQQKLLNPPRPEVSWWTGAFRPVYPMLPQV